LFLFLDFAVHQGVGNPFEHSSFLILFDCTFG
jgi:hypothetical protein